MEIKSSQDTSKSSVVWDSFFAPMTDGVVLLGDKNQILYANPKAKNLLNLPEIHADVQWVSHLKERFQTETDLSKLDWKQAPLQFRLSRPESETYHPLYLSCLGFQGVLPPAARVLLVLDETDKHMEGKLKSDFLTLISHKLRTPVVALSYAMNLVNRRKDLRFSEEEADDFLRQAYFKSFEISELIEKLIRFCSVIKDRYYDRKESFELRDLIKEVLERYDRKFKAIRPPHTIETVWKEKAPSVMIALPRDYMALVVENLVDNAVKFNNKENPKVTITVDPVQNQKLFLSVTDNGPGIPSEMHANIFDEFFQIEKYFTGAVEGVGLGLTLVKRILSAYEQEIFVESELGRGTTIRFSMPVVS